MAALDAQERPIRGKALRITFPIFDADGDLVSGATGLDTEISKDGAAFADATNEATEIAQGMYYLDLTATEMDADIIAGVVKTSSSGAKTTPFVIYTRAEHDGTSQGVVGGAETTTVRLAADASATDDVYNGKRITITAGPGNGQSRVITDYAGATRACTINKAWLRQPTSTSEYSVH